MPSHQIIDNPAEDRFPGQVCIATIEDDGTVSSLSWAPPDIDPAVRLNLDIGTADDKRTTTPNEAVAYRVPDEAEFRALSNMKRSEYELDGGKDDHRVVATYAAVKEIVTVEAAAAAAALEPADLVAEAQAWDAAVKLEQVAIKG